MTRVVTLGWRLAGAFLELWLGMASLELWLRVEGKHVAFLKLWLKIADGTCMNVQVVA